MLNTSTEFGYSPSKESIPPSVTIESQSPSDSIACPEEDEHPSISPATPAESLFLSHLPTNRISAAALASSIHRTHSARSVRSAFSAATDDFLSAQESIDSAQEYETPRNNYSKPLFGTDILVFASQNNNPTTIDEDKEHSFSTDTSNKMLRSASSSKSMAKGTIPTKSAAPKPATEEDPHFDAATHLYTTVKSVWSWSRSLPVAGPILGLYESAGAKILTTATHKDVETVDKELAFHINGLDKDVIDPAIAALLQVIFPAVEKVEDIIKVVGPKIPFMVYIFPMLTEEGEKNSPETSTPAALEVN